MKPEQITKTAWQLILTRIRDRRTDGDTLEKIGKSCGVSKATVQRWIESDAGGDRTSFTDMLRYLTALNIPIQKVMRSMSNPPSIPAVKVPCTEPINHEELQKKNLTVLGVYAVAGAGPAWEQEEADPIFSIAVPDMYLRKDISTLLISGSSMEPTIVDKAVVGVDREEISIIQGKIYAVRLPYEGIVVKRVYLDHVKKSFILRSDNKKSVSEYPDIPIPFEEGNSFIYGKVVWVLQAY